MYCQNKDIHSLCNTLNSDLQHIIKWLLCNQLTLNIRKTYYRVFSLKRVPDGIRVVIDGRELEPKSQGKFLGIILDEKLTFRDHVNMITKKLSRIVGILHRLKLYFPPFILRQIYFSLAYPHLTYCILACGPKV